MKKSRNSNPSNITYLATLYTRYTERIKSIAAAGPVSFEEACIIAQDCPNLSLKILLPSGESPDVRIFYYSIYIAHEGIEEVVWALPISLGLDPIVFEDHLDQPAQNDADKSDRFRVIGTGEPDVGAYFKAAIEAAQSDPDWFDALSLATASLVEQGTSLKEPLNQWAAAKIRGQVLPPKRKPGRHQNSMVERDQNIAAAVSYMRMLGLPPTRNIASEPHSGCDAVATAIREKGLAMSYDAICKIWQKVRSSSGQVFPGEC